MINKLTLCGLVALTITSCQKDQEFKSPTETNENKELEIQAKYSGTAIDPTNMYLTDAGTIHNQLMEDIRAAYPSGVDFSTNPVEDITYPYTHAYFAGSGSIGTQSDVDVLAYIDDYHYCRHHRPRYIYSKGAFDSAADEIMVDITESSYLGTVDKQILTDLMNAAKMYISTNNPIEYQAAINTLKSQAKGSGEEIKVDIVNKDPLTKEGNKSLVILGIAQAALNYQLSQGPIANPIPSDPDEIKGAMPKALGSLFGGVISLLKLENQQSLKSVGGIINGAVQSTAFMELDQF